MSKVESFEILIPQLNRLRTVWVYLPDNYNKKGNPYPVIYMQDGQNIFHDRLSTNGNAWHVNNTMDEIFHLTGMSAIVVGVESNGSRRNSEYSPWRTALSDKKFTFHNRGGEGVKYAEFLAKNLKTEIDRRYNTDKQRIATAVVGSGMGGFISLYIGLKYQRLFDSMGLFSPFTPFNRVACRRFLKKTPQILPQHALVYCGGKENISVTDKVMERACTELYGSLAMRNITTELIFNSSFTHCERAWDKYFKKFAQDFLQRYYTQL